MSVLLIFNSLNLKDHQQKMSNARLPRRSPIISSNPPEATKRDDSIETGTIGPKQIKTNHTLIRHLSDNEWERLDWKSPFGFKGMIRIRTPKDGSCFFHALAKSYFRPYMTGKLDGEPFNKKEFIKNLRKSLAEKLASRVKPTDPASLRHYDLLSRGTLEEFSKSVPAYSLENMQKELMDPSKPVDNVYNEFISNQLNKDIYILDAVKRDVYITGDDDEILYKGRPSIVILYFPGHYELIGLKTDEKLKVLFDPNHSFIRTIRKRMSVIRADKELSNDRKD